VIPYLAIGAVIIIAYFLLEAMPNQTVQSGTAASQIALAIGVAEGGYDANGNNLGNGTLPSQNHNPGDLTVDVSGNGTGSNAGFVVYPDDATGYAALEDQVNEWLNGTSANANSDSTIDDISKFYTTTDQSAWAANVAAVLGVPSSTPIGQIQNPQAAATAAAAEVPAPATVDQLADNSGDMSDAPTNDDGEGE